MQAREFVDIAQQQGFDFYTGVPCSFLTPLINETASRQDIDYLISTSEGEAIAIAAGAWLAGRKTVVMGQNSGLGNMINPLTSLNHPFRIPTLLLLTWRGEPGIRDEPQHALMGTVMGRLLDLAEVANAPLPSTPAHLRSSLLDAVEPAARGGVPFAFVAKQGAFSDTVLREPAFPTAVKSSVEPSGMDPRRPARFEVLEWLLALVSDEAAIIATTGKCGRELHTLGDRPQHLYMVGAMGSASAVGLGVALNSNRPVVVLDGDGAALMRLGTLATIGAYRPSNLLHVILDNGVHDSTGGQKTVAPMIDFAAVGAACGYRHVMRCEGLDGFAEGFARLSEAPGPNLLHLPIAPGSLAKLGRPGLPPFEVARRFAAFVQDTPSAAAQQAGARVAGGGAGAGPGR